MQTLEQCLMVLEIEYLSWFLHSCWGFMVVASRCGLGWPQIWGSFHSMASWVLGLQAQATRPRRYLANQSAPVFFSSYTGIWTKALHTLRAHMLHYWAVSQALQQILFSAHGLYTEGSCLLHANINQDIKWNRNHWTHKRNKLSGSGLNEKNIHWKWMWVSGANAGSTPDPPSRHCRERGGEVHQCFVLTPFTPYVSFSSLSRLETTLSLQRSPFRCIVPHFLQTLQAKVSLFLLHKYN